MTSDGEVPIRRLLLVGAGGAGQRQLRVLRRLLGFGEEWLTVRHRDTTPVLDASMRPTPGSIEDAYRLRRVADLDAGLAEQPDAVLVTNPTSMHAETVLASVRSGAHVLVEKPLAATAEEADQLLAALENSGRSCLIGFQRRFHPAWRRTVALIADGAVGHVQRALFRAHSDVRRWHPYEPLGELYALRSDLGGGALRTECHELDQAVDLFGAMEFAQVRGDRCGFDGRGTFDVETTASLTVTCPSSGDDARSEVEVNFSMSLVADEPERSWTIEGDRGTIRWDEATATLDLTGDRSGREAFGGFDNESLAAVQAEWWCVALAGGPPYRDLQGRLRQAMSVDRVIDQALSALP